MPTLLQLFGFRFYIYSEEHEPIHVHVDYGDGWAKIELDPTVRLVENHGMKQREIKKVVGLAELYQEEFIACWKEYFKNGRNGKNN